MKYTHYKSRFSSKDKGVQHLQGEWSEIVEIVTNKSQWHTFKATNTQNYNNLKAQFDAIVMAEMKPNMPRTADNVIAFHAIVLDVDDGATYEDVQKDLAGYEYVMYSSGSTGLKSGDRFRVILPLNTPMNANDWKNFNTSLSERFPYSDECFKKGIQIQYLPVLNKAFEDQFISYHNVGKWFDYQNPEDLPYVECQSLELITKNVVFDALQFSDIEFQELAKAIVEHQSGSLGYEERRLLAQRLKHIGMNDFDAVMILDAVSRPGFSTSNSDLVRHANPIYAHPEGLYKHVAKGVRIPALERRIVRAEVNVAVSQYDGEWYLKYDEYLSEIFHEMDFSSGVNLLISDVNTGKSTQFMVFDSEGNPVGTKAGYMFLAPLTSIVRSFNGDNRTSGTGVATWNQIESIIRERDKSKFRDTVLIIDECHGLFEDYGYKSKLINRLIDSFKHFKSVILMSGTVEADYFSSIQFNKVYRVHKPSQATKNLRTIFSTKKDDLVIEHINALFNKTIVLMNNKDLIQVVQKRLQRKCLVITADNKNDPEVQAFFETGLMGQYEVILGTNSIVEGLSIIDELESVDIVIWGDLVPERIEQFTNRFRRVSTVKNVWYFVDRKPIELIEDYNRSEVLADAMGLTESLQELYGAIRTETLQRSFIRQFSGDMSKDLVYYHDGKFCVSFTGVDYEYSQHRAVQYRNDFSVFSQRLIQFGFQVYAPIVADGDVLAQEQISESRALVAEMRKNERTAILTSLKDDIEADTVLHEEDATELYNASYGSIQKLLAKGLDRADVGKLIDLYIDDERIFAKAHEDADFIQTGESVREMVIAEINGRTELQSQDTQDIADKVIAKVLVDYFAGDVARMVASRSWGTLVVKSHAYRTNDLNILDPQACDLQAKSSKAAKEILQKFILLGKGRTKSIQGKNVRITPVLALSLTGLTFRTFDFTKILNPSIEVLKTKLVKTKKSFADMVQDAHEITKELSPYERGTLSRMISSQASMTEEEKATYIACRKFALFKTQTAQEIVDSLE